MNQPDASDRLNAATFAAQAARYAEHRPRYPAALVQALAALAPARDAAWDCGTGNGQLAGDLAGHFEHVVATDCSAEQIALAPAHPRVDYRVVAAEDTALPAASVSLVVVAQAVHWFDLDRFYPRVHHALRERGVFAAIAYGGFAAEPAIDATIRGLTHDRLAPYWSRGNRLVWDGYRELPFPFDEIALPRFELVVDWTLEQHLGHMASWSSWQRYVQERGDDLSTPLREALAPLWGDGVRRLSTPLAVRAGRLGARPRTRPG